MSSRTLVVIFLVVGAFAGALEAAPAWARTDAEIRDAIESALSQRHPTDTAEWWRGLGPDAPKIILSMLTADPPPSIYHRVRLTEALGWFDDPAAVEFLKKQALESSNGVVKNAAIGGIARSQGPKELDFIEQFLKDPDPQTRYATARALALMPGDDERAKKALADYLASEKTAWIGEKLRADEARAKASKTPIASDEAPDPAFAGTWRGYWLEASGSALSHDPLELKLELANGVLKGTLSRKRQKKVEDLSLAKVQAKKNRFTAVISVRAGKKTHEVPLEAELIHLPDPSAAPMLEIRALQAGAIAVLRR